MKGWISQWYRNVPFCWKRIANERPGLIRPLSKTPLPVAVWAVPEELEKTTFVPVAISSLGGRNLKLSMSTVFAPLACAGPGRAA
jgi:hypothetical protein